MPSTLKRPSLGRLLASLRPSRASTFPVQTGFPTSLADLVVRNHGRLRKGARKPRRPAASSALVPPPSTVALPVELADELPLPPPPPTARPLSQVAVRRPDAAPRGGGAAVFRFRPQLLALGGAVALALLAVWSQGTVAAFTVAALSLLWIESASASRRRRSRPRPAKTAAMLDSCVSPIREAEEAHWRSSCSGSDSDRGNEAPSPRTAESPELVAADGDDPTDPKRERNKRSLRKLISKKLQKKRESKDSSSSCDGDAEQLETAAGDTDPVRKNEAFAPFSTEQTPSESSIEWSSSSSSLVVDGRAGPGVRFPLSAFIPVILAGLAAGKLPATALAVLCVALFSTAAQRLQ